MSQNKFVSLPVLQLNPSKVLLFLIIGLHLIALASVMVNIYFHISVNIILALFIMYSFYYYLLYFKKTKDLKTIKYRSDGVWVLSYESESLLASVEPDYMLTEWLIILRFKIGKKKKSIPVFIDMLSPQSFKQLRVALPYISKFKTSDPMANI